MLKYITRLLTTNELNKQHKKIEMPSDLRKRKADPNGLPSSVSNPKPRPNEVGHAASNRQSPTIAPTVFIILIVGLMFSLFPIFYYTQVMIPDPESKSILSQFRLQGNILLNALGHTSSSGDGRIPFNAHHKQQHSSSHNNGATAPTEEPQTASPASSSLGQTTAQISPSTPTTTKEQTKVKEPLSPEAQKKLDEELGIFWEASSRYRREAQKQKVGEYTLKGDGTTTTKTPDSSSSDQEETQQANPSITKPEQLQIDHLPDADPDAKDGLTPEFWDAIKDQLSADDLTLVLNDIRRSEQAAAATAAPI
ncbi:hypothetical protein MJO28_006048 [Puccinia striiformis f. sp. tritici]|uniref:Uncharacterized protein n=1 Tax=Puccinia striiformis f. sp. tritici TaxID=168172 RepID=A0ACC0EJA6_9BASI|nr:hypothetical protein MJO28_006048 [Puccinia striiformis f. sp. tritici]